MLSLFRHFFQKVLNTRTRYENVQLKNDFALPVVGVAPVESILDKRELLVIIVTNILPIIMVWCNSHTSYFRVERSFLFLNALKPLKSKAGGPAELSENTFVSLGFNRQESPKHGGIILG